MDDELKQLEAELRRLRPRAASRMLREAISGDLEPANREEEVVPRRAGLILSWLALPIAAAVALIFAFAPTSPEISDVAAADAAAVEKLFKPVTAQNVLLDSRDEGYVTFDDGTQARRVREVSIDTITWKNPRTNASLVWSVPREEVRVVPVSLQ